MFRPIESLMTREREHQVNPTRKNRRTPKFTSSRRSGHPTTGQSLGFFRGAPAPRLCLARVHAHQGVGVALEEPVNGPLLPGPAGTACTTGEIPLPPLTADGATSEA